MSYTGKILLSMFLGISFGSLINIFFFDNFFAILLSEILSALGEIFISSLKLMVVPLVFFSLIVGVAQIENSSKLGSISIKAVCLYLATTSIAIALALSFASLFDIGSGIGLSTDLEFSAPSAPSLKEVFVSIFPSNPIRSMAEGEMLQIIVFSLLIGFGVKGLSNKNEKIISFFQSGNNLMLKIVEIIIWFAPYGIFCLLSDIFSKIGFSIITDLASYFVLLVFVLLFHGFIIYSFFLYFFTRLSPLVFFKN